MYHMHLILNTLSHYASSGYDVHYIHYTRAIFFVLEVWRRKSQKTTHCMHHTPHVQHILCWKLLTNHVFKFHFQSECSLVLSRLLCSGIGHSTWSHTIRKVVLIISHLLVHKFIFPDRDSTIVIHLFIWYQGGLSISRTHVDSLWY